MSLQIMGKVMDGVRLAGARRAVKQEALLGCLPKLRQSLPSLNELDDVSFQEVQRGRWKNHLITLDPAELMDCDSRRFARVRVFCEFQRKNFSPVRLAFEYGLFQMFEKV